ncbi:MAG: hypothetical protein IJT34_10615 [Butyrivibrio sp.]|nr:hypothetical protein [Butyrivibrio sp.]
MRVLFSAGSVKEVSQAEVVPMDVGNGEVIGTQVNFVLSPSGDQLQYIYAEHIPLEESGERAIAFIQKLYQNGFADFSGEPVEQL